MKKTLNAPTLKTIIIFILFLIAPLVQADEKPEATPEAVQADEKPEPLLILVLKKIHLG
jgi:hypothetical protein